LAGGGERCPFLVADADPVRDALSVERYHRAANHPIGRQAQFAKTAVRIAISTGQIMGDGNSNPC
jgi:hypothetical protein